MADPLQVAVRFSLYAVLGLLFGLPMFALYGVDREGRASLALRRLIAGGALLGLALSMLGLVVLAASMAGMPLAQVDRGSIEMVATMPGIGTAWLMRVAALSALLLAAIAVRASSRLAVAAAVLGGIALASLAGTGHAAMTEGPAGPVHLAADVAHLLAAGAWLGALAGLLQLIIHPSRTDQIAAAHRVLAAFSGAGSVIVGTLVFSGVVNGYFIVGLEILALGKSTYGQLLLVKLGLFAVMLALAAAHRFRMTPALATASEHDATGALAQLRISMAIEAGLGIGILGLVAWMGLMEPAGIY